MNERHLTHGQSAWLRAELEQRKQQLAQRTREHRGGRSRVEHAREARLQDGDDAPQRESEREVDNALSEFERRELERVSEALERFDADTYGSCGDCGADIPFDRLRAEPWAERCVLCESARERDAMRRRG
jgi:DnaK suppressor protein